MYYRASDKTFDERTAKKKLLRSKTPPNQQLGGNMVACDITVSESEWVNPSISQETRASSSGRRRVALVAPPYSNLNEKVTHPNTNKRTLNSTDTEHCTSNDAQHFCTKVQRKLHSPRAPTKQNTAVAAERKQHPFTADNHPLE